MPKVSIWFTSYNHGNLLRESIECALNQTYQDYELIIVDDCSTDNSQDIIREYAAIDSRIRTIFHEINYGQSGFEDELEYFNGDYVAILHGDDKWEKDKLEKQVSYLELHQDVEACFTEVQVIDSAGNEYSKDHPYSRNFATGNRTRYEWLRYFFHYGNCLCHPSLMIRKGAYKRYDLFSSGLSSLPDFEKWIKLCLKANIYIIQEKLTKFRMHDNGNNVSADTEQKIKKMFFEEYPVYRNFFEIDDLQTLLGVFPECVKYIKNGECNIKFALAKMFLDGPRNSHRLLGLNAIYDLLKNEDSRKELEYLYGYSRKEYDQDKQKYDIFGNLPEERFLKTSVYVDTGMGFNEEESLKKKVYISNIGIAQIDFDLSEIKKSKDIQRIRFDLDEGVYRECTVLDAVWDNGKKCEIKNVNGVRAEGTDKFFTLDPQYAIKRSSCRSLHLVLKVGLLSAEEVEQYFADLRNNYSPVRRIVSRKCRALKKDIHRWKKRY